MGAYSRVVADIGKQARSNSVAAGLGFAYSQFVVMAMYGLISYFAGQEIVSGRANFEAVLKVRRLLSRCKGVGSLVDS